MNDPVTPAQLDGCGLEPIHIPGSIQPHGALLVLQEADLICVQASANCGAFLGGKFTGVVGRRLEDVAPGAAARIMQVLAGASEVLPSPITVEIGQESFDVSLHRTEAGLITEFEAAGPQDAHYHRHLQQALSDLKAAPDLTTQHQRALAFVSQLTGFERVMMYRFDPDWHGQVVAEHLSAPVESYDGLHFPATDIPPQARELYRKSWLRLIPSSSYQPVPVEPVVNPATGKPLDMSFVSLRSVSPIHLEYLRNMNVAASMSISLIVEGRLWGLIACHHRTPRVLPFAIRAVCEIFGQVVSFEIGARQEAQRLSQYVQATEIQSRFFDVIAGEKNVLDALVKYTPQLLEFMGAGGAAVHVNQQTTLLGETPSAEQVGGLISWLQTQELNPVFETEALSQHYPPAAAFHATGSGLLAVKLSRVEPHYLLWFRPEVVQTVTWAGRPDKPLDANERLNPRKSFAAWQEKVTGRARSWGEAERRGAQELMLAINALVLRRTQTLLSENMELERRNTDLNSFAYIAAHDLREPLRGLQNYLVFMREDHGRELSSEALRKVQTMESLVAQSKELIETLNRYSRIGRMEISAHTVNLDTVVDEVLVSLSGMLRELGVEVRRPHPLPTISCDPVLTREVFSNLLTNAAKYSDSERKWIEVGSMAGQPGEPPTFYVRDNGIGIREKHFTDIFRMFRRLHPHDAYTGGTGAGLTIAKNIVERHGGRIWLESAFGQGTTFYFQFQPQ
ncbi:ATP-binding protein [Prosthecobacter sp.]|uniref:ATP-binding protein n=1 Tax=Prosthecobacter sp. TaxID=1965333 RepID=UPI00378318BA